jgi:hypothetical protein
METPSLPVAFSITIMIPSYGQTSIILTWIQGPSDKWKTFVGSRVAIIQDETSAVWRHVPSQSSPAYLISRGTEPTTLPSPTLWWKGPQLSSLVSRCVIPVVRRLNQTIRYMHISSNITIYEVVCYLLYVKHKYTVPQYRGYTHYTHD